MTCFLDFMSLVMGTEQKCFRGTMRSVFRKGHSGTDGGGVLERQHSLRATTTVYPGTLVGTDRKGGVLASGPRAGALETKPLKFLPLAPRLRWLMSLENKPAPDPASRSRSNLIRLLIRVGEAFPFMEGPLNHEGK